MFVWFPGGVGGPVGRRRATEVVPGAGTGWSHWLGWGRVGGVVRLSGGSEAVGWASEERRRIGGVSPWAGVARRPGVGGKGRREGEAGGSRREAVLSSFSWSWKPKVSTTRDHETARDFKCPHFSLRPITNWEPKAAKGPWVFGRIAGRPQSCSPGFLLGSAPLLRSLPAGLPHQVRAGVAPARKF